MVVAAALVATLALLALPLAEMSLKRQKEAQLASALRDIRDAIDAYKKAADEGRIARPADTSGYPPTLDVLVGGVDDLAAPRGSRLYFLRRLPRDPLFPDPEAPAASTWGQRSYDSPPERPLAGRDVYDVYSLSGERALNGTLYREW